MRKFEQTRIKLAKAYYSKGFAICDNAESDDDLNNAIECFKLALKYSNNPNYRIALGNALHDIGKFEESFSELNEAIDALSERYDYLLQKSFDCETKEVTK